MVFHDLRQDRRERREGKREPWEARENEETVARAGEHGREVDLDFAWTECKVRMRHYVQIILQGARNKLNKQINKLKLNS